MPLTQLEDTLCETCLKLKQIIGGNKVTYGTCRALTDFYFNNKKPNKPAPTECWAFCGDFDKMVKTQEDINAYQRKKEPNRPLKTHELHGLAQVYHEETHPQLLSPPHADKSEKKASKPRRFNPILDPWRKGDSWSSITDRAESYDDVVGSSSYTAKEKKREEREKKKAERELKKSGRSSKSKPARLKQV